MAKFRVISDIGVQGITQTAPGEESLAELRNGVFHTGEEVYGEIIPNTDTFLSNQGFTFVNKGVYWRMPLNYLELIDATATETAPGTQSNNDSNGSGQASNMGSSAPTTGAASLLPSSFMEPGNKTPMFIGALVGGFVGMRVADNLKIFPPIMNWILFTGLGLYGGYKGTEKLMEKVKTSNK